MMLTAIFTVFHFQMKACKPLKYNEAMQLTVATMSTYLHRCQAIARQWSYILLGKWSSR